jgi:hypothetical protein
MLALLSAFFIGLSGQVEARCYPGDDLIADYQEYMNTVTDNSVSLHRLRDVKGFVDFLNSEYGVDYRYPKSIYYFANDKDNSAVIAWVDPEGCVVFKVQAMLKNIVQFIKGPEA